MTSPAVVRFRARGPIDIEPDRLVPLDPEATNVFWRLSRAMLRVGMAAVRAFEVYGCIVLLPVLFPCLILYLLGLPFWLRERIGHAVRADRSGIRLRGELIGWDAVEEVRLDNVHYSGGEWAKIEHAVIIDMGDARRALLFSSFDRADDLSERLEFLRRNSQGSATEVPVSLAATRDAARLELKPPPQ